MLFKKPTSKLTLLIDKLGSFCFWSFIVYLGFALFVEAAFSFSWPKVADVGFLYYLSWLIDAHNIQPYLHLYDTSFPGTFIFHILIGKIFGYGDIGFHCADILFLCVLLAMTWFLLKPLHVRAAATAVIFFGLYYFVTATIDMHFQRDYLAILPIVASLLIAQRCQRFEFLTFFGIGFLFAMSASIKPHFAISLPIIMGYAMIVQADHNNILVRHRRFRACFYLLAGFLFWLTICGIWLFVKGSLSSFVLMVTKYLPIYMNMDGSQSVIVSDNYWQDFLSQLFDSKKYHLFVAGIASAWALAAVSFKRQNSALIMCIFLLCILYIIYVGLGGKGWDYHWMPFIYFHIVCLSFFLIPAKEKSSTWQGRAVMLFLIGFFIFSMNTYYYPILKPIFKPKDTYQTTQQLHNEFLHYPYEDTATLDLVDYLKNRTHPGDRIEFRKDGSYGPLFPALLQLQLLPASSFPLQTMLYRTTDNAYIQSLRQQLLQEISEKPKILIDDGQFAPEGNNGFPEYEKFIRDNYEWKYDNLERMQIPYYFSVYERKRR